MATGFDRSKYRNPDMPVGYERKKPTLVLNDDLFILIDGTPISLIQIMAEVDCDSRPDYDEFTDLGFLSDSDEDEATIVYSSPIKKKKKKDDVNVKMELDENDHKRQHHSKKKDHDKKGSSPLQDTFVKMEIDPDKHEKGGVKKKKSKKIKKERSDSTSPVRSFKHSPPSRRSPSPGYKSRRSPSPGYKSRHSPSPGHKGHRHRTPSPNYHLDSPSRKKVDKIVNYSRSPSPVDVKPDMNVKLEPGVPQHLYGSYHCDVCNITMNSLLTFNTHQHGKKHIKALKTKNMGQVVARSIPVANVSENQSKYPKLTAGCKRRRVATISVIQDYVEQNLTKPCPGLNFLIEVRLLGKTEYYCMLCDSSCSADSIMPHLNGFKHQLHCLRHFKPGAYEAMQFEPKYKIEKEITGILAAVEKKEGRGRITVEIEELDPTGSLLNIHQPSTSSQSQPSTSSRNQPSTSSRSQSATSSRSQSSSRDRDRNQPSTSRGTDSSRPDSFQELYERTTVPSSKSSDFFCKTCQSHMNSLQMWESHIRGKRHLTNIKKLPGDKPSKTKTVQVPNRKAYLLERIKKELRDEPVVGLSEIRETEVLETRSHTYQCFLCGSCHTSMDIIDHIISLKHRSKYLDHVEFPGREVTYGMSESVAYGIVKEMCAQVQEDEGTGKPEVHVNKSGLYR